MLFLYSSCTAGQVHQLFPSPRWSSIYPRFLTTKYTGSFVEFLDIIPILAASTSPAYHIIVPSLPGYAYSTQGPLNKPFGLADVAYLMNELMIGLGLGASSGGYIAQGGDLGSIIARIQQSRYPDCKGEFSLHLFLLHTPLTLLLSLQLSMVSLTPPPLLTLLNPLTPAQSQHVHPGRGTHARRPLRARSHQCIALRFLPQHRLSVCPNARDKA